MRCATCVLTSEEGVSLPLEAFLDQLDTCDECPLARGQEPCPPAAMGRLAQRAQASSRALRKLGNRLRQAEQVTKDLSAGIAEYEERAATLEALQQAGNLEANRELRAKMALVEQKEAAILALMTPIIEVWEGILVLPIVGVLDEQRTGVMLSTLLERVSQGAAAYAILDLTGVDRIDAATAAQLVRICRAVALLGAGVILCGIRVEVVLALTHLRLDLTSIATMRTLKEALLRCGVGAGG
jgi:rsbT co-antagonist protein RsbR